MTSSLLNGPCVRTVSVIVPCRNEIRLIRSFLESLLRQDLGPDLDCEFLIADGMSNDGTRQVLADFQSRFTSLVIRDNQSQTVSSGLNSGILQARGNIIIRMDVHSEYAPDYIRQCVITLEDTGADNVGGPALPTGLSYLQRSICLAYQSAFGCGGARFHDPSFEGYVDTVTYGCWRKSTLIRLGLFDEELVRNQDDELNLRLTRSGGKIWQTPRIRSWYHPRSTLRELARQHLQYGYWKARVIRKHKIPASARHLVPGGFALTLLLLSTAALFWPFSARMLALLLTTYGVASVLASLIACWKRRNLLFLPVMPVVFAAYHLPYGLGFLGGLCDIILRRRPSRTLTALTR